MSEPKSRLGQGLDDLMGDTDPESSDPGLTELPLDAITPNPAQPRDRFDPEKLEELTNSIRQQGVVEPVLVRPHPEDEAPYQLVAGERRWRAAAQAGLDRLPAVVRDLSSEQALVVSLVENIQRENLGPLEEARAYRRLLDRDAMSQKELGEKLGKSRSAIANRLRLLELPEAIRTALHQGDLCGPRPGSSGMRERGGGASGLRADPGGGADRAGDRTLGGPSARDDVPRRLGRRGGLQLRVPLALSTPGISPRGGHRGPGPRGKRGPALR